MTPFETLLYWCKERESIRKLKASCALPPWTKDPIFQFRFTNLRRKDDRVSQWLIQNILKQEYINYDLRAFLLFSAWCRYVNWPPTIKAAMVAGFYPRRRINWRKLGQFVDDRAKSGQKTWTGAYMVQASPDPDVGKGKFVSERIIGRNLSRVVSRLCCDYEGSFGLGLSVRHVWEKLCQASGVASFTAGQIVADWSYTPLLCNAFDLYNWAPMGPGSIRGYNRILGIQPLAKPPLYLDWCNNLAVWRRAIIDHLGSEYEDLTAMDVQNSLCELSKVLKLKEGSGRPRAKYKPETAF